MRGTENDDREGREGTQGTESREGKSAWNENEESAWNENEESAWKPQCIVCSAPALLIAHVAEVFGVTHVTLTSPPYNPITL